MQFFLKHNWAPVENTLVEKENIGESITLLMLGVQSVWMDHIETTAKDRNDENVDWKGGGLHGC